MRAVSLALMTVLGIVVAGAAGQAPATPAGPDRVGGAAPTQPPPDPTVMGRTPEGFTLRLAKKTNHLSNYNESIVPAYTLPDPLVMFDGRPVKTRRDFGETVDDMAQNYHWQFSSRFQQWVGRWSDMPVDAHSLIALSAPRPVFITGGTTDQWSDPKGEFLAEVAASPVYHLLGAKGIGASELPPVETTLASGDLAWHYHTGGHMLTVDEWKAFLAFMDRYFKT